MATDRRKQVVLGVLLVVLAVVLYRTYVASAPHSASASNPSRAAAAPRAGAQPAGPTAPEVHLEALSDERPKPVEGDRNLFRFKQKAPPPPPQARGGVASTAPVAPAPPPGPPPLPPIPLKFIGIVEPGPGRPKVAVLTDGQGQPLKGREGDIVAGRYRILHIGVESIEMAYLDGRGRQTIRMTGS